MKVTGKLCEQREPQSANMYSLSLFLCHSTTCRVHILHSVCLAAGQLVTHQSLNLQHCYTDFGMWWWQERSIPHAGLDHCALWPDHAVQHAYVDRHLATSVLPDAARWTTTHAADRHARTGGPGTEVACVDLTLMFRGVG